MVIKYLFLCYVLLLCLGQFQSRVAPPLNVAGLRVLPRTMIRISRWPKNRNLNLKRLNGKRINGKTINGKTLEGLIEGIDVGGIDVEVDDTDYCKSICQDGELAHNIEGTICNIRYNNCMNNAWFVGTHTFYGYEIALDTFLKSTGLKSPDPCIQYEGWRENTEDAECRDVCEDHQIQTKFIPLEACQLPQVCCLRRDLQDADPCFDVDRKKMNTTNCRESCNKYETQLEFVPREVCNPGLKCCSHLAQLVR